MSIGTPCNGHRTLPAARCPFGIEPVGYFQGVWIQLDDSIDGRTALVYGGDAL
jgi:hypothetical protein